MENLFAFLDKISAMLGIRSVYFHFLFKTLFAIVVSYIVWLILLRILTAFEKKTQKTDNIQKKTNILRVIRKALFYCVIILNCTYIIRLY